MPVDEAVATDLAFDHGELRGQCVSGLRRDVEDMNLPLAAFPGSFTLGELQRLCEELLRRPLDKSSFRAKQLVETVPDKMRDGRTRPTRVFRKKKAPL